MPVKLIAGTAIGSYSDNICYIPTDRKTADVKQVDED
jgi:hypothetical protein